MCDTIAAIATPSGTGGIGIIRISGPKSKERLTELFHSVSPKFTDFKPWMLHRGYLVAPTNEFLDDILAVYMPAPYTFTGEDVVELHCHGGHFLLLTILETVLCKNIRLAKPGEFSQRAFLNGRMDLTQAEAVAELIAASSRNEVLLASNRLKGLLGQKIIDIRRRIEELRVWICLAVDFPEEETGIFPLEKFINGLLEIHEIIQKLIHAAERSRCWKEGVIVALAGAVNAGKSSLLNALLGKERAIVTEHPGTTRDFLEECIIVNGLSIRLIDTAGLRVTSDPIEEQGIQKGREKIDEADAILFIIDGMVGITEESKSLLNSFGIERTILVWNKIDLKVPPSNWIELCTSSQVNGVCVSAKTGSGIEELLVLLYNFVLSQHNTQEPIFDTIVPNMRQVEIFSLVLEEIRSLYEDIRSGIPYDLCAVMLENISSMLNSIIGFDTPEEVLNRIFASFCIGK